MIIDVTNSGVVLLTPFLPRLFREVGFVNNDRFVSEEAKHSASHLLHYTATGNCDGSGEDLILNSVLCGLRLAQSLSSSPKINGVHKGEVNAMLEAAISHWDAIKNISTAAFRTHFLQRYGVLQEDEYGIKLQVKRIGMDRLLASLPWAISPVQFPWMTDRINVNW